MTRHDEPTPIAGREVPALAADLARQFAKDTELARRLNDAHSRLVEANHRLWSGLDPTGLRAVYGDHPQFQVVQLEAALDSCSAVLDSPDSLGALQDAHWQIHRAHVDYQHTAEDRRVLAAEIGEASVRLIDALVAHGWSEQQARNANVHELAAGEWETD
jgi:hypothetical protein